MKFYIYKITNLVNGKIYIGAHEGELDDGYFGSGKLILAAIKKYGKQNFSKEILERCSSREALFIREAEIVTEHFIKSEDNYNLVPGGSGGSILSNRKPFTEMHSSETKKRISDSLKGRVVSNETRKRLSENNWARTNPEAQRLSAKKAAASRKTWKAPSNKTKEKISVALTGVLQEIVKCPVCGNSGGKNAMRRWHFENCKMKA
jgi:hypothetical protein